MEENKEPLSPKIGISQEDKAIQEQSNENDSKIFTMSFPELLDD